MRTRRPSRFPRKLVSVPLAVGAVAVPLALGPLAARAGDVKGKIVGYENLRPSALSSIDAADKKLFNLREFDPLVPQKFTTISAKPDKDLTMAIYGPGGAEGFGLGLTIRLAGGRAVPATAVVPPKVPIIFRNDDPFVHHITGPDVDRDLKPGESHKFEPKAKGTTTFTDTLIPSVKAWVVVEDGVIANRPVGWDGSVKLTDVVAGEYAVKVFFEGNARKQFDFKVAEKGVVEIKDPIAVAAAGSASK